MRARVWKKSVCCCHARADLPAGKEQSTLSQAGTETDDPQYYSELSSLASASAKFAASQPSTPHHTRAEKAHALQHTATAASRNAYIISIKVAERACVAVGIQGQVWGSQARTSHPSAQSGLTWLRKKHSMAVCMKS